MPEGHPAGGASPGVVLPDRSLPAAPEVSRSVQRSAPAAGQSADNRGNQEGPTSAVSPSRDVHRRGETRPEGAVQRAEGVLDTQSQSRLLPGPSADRCLSTNAFAERASLLVLCYYLR